MAGTICICARCRFDLGLCFSLFAIRNTCRREKKKKNLTILTLMAKLVTLKNILNQWTTRNLTLIGRICIVKTLAISTLVYNTSALKVPPNFAKKVNDICFKFIWNFKPDKVKRQTIVLPVDKGGLNMVDFTILDKSLKAAWVKRFCEADGSKWCSVFSSIIAQCRGRFIFECNFDIRDLNLTSRVPRFYTDILTVWQKWHSKNPSTTMEYLHKTIWNILRPIYTVRLCSIRQAYDRPTT